MSGMEHYRGSQAFNHGLLVNESVTPNTGSLVVSFPLVALKGVNPACDLNLNLTFTGTATPILGLAAGWSLDLPYIVGGKVLSARGKTHLIDENWSDQHGHKSGLRYLNDHGVRFERFLEPRATPSGKNHYAFCLQHADYSREYFDMSGKLVEREDRFGNRLIFNYFDGAAGVFDNRLIAIQDSFGQIVKFDYDTWKTSVELPSGGRTVIHSGGDDIVAVENAVGLRTLFGYDTFAGRKVVSMITYANGLETRVHYGALRGLVDNGEIHFPAVSELSHWTASAGRLDRADFTFGEKSGGNTFTGAGAGYRLNGNGDGLMESHDLDYRYDVTVRVLGPKDEILVSRRSFFNYLHLPITEESHLVTTPDAHPQGRKVTFVYPEFLEAHARTTNYAKPLETVEWGYSEAEGDYVAFGKTERRYDLFGETTSVVHWLFDRDKAEFVKLATEIFEHADTPVGRRMPKCSVVTDEVSGMRRRLEFKATADGNNIAEATLSWIEGEGEWKPLKTKSFEYDSQGRMNRWRLRWAEECTDRSGAIEETWGEESHAFDPVTHRLTVTARDAEGGESAVLFDTGSLGLPMVEKRSATGRKHLYTYDPLGRLIEVKGPDDAVTRYDYVIRDGKAVATVTGPAGYATESLHDELGRLIRIADNGDPTSDGSRVSRVLGTQSYDAAGRVIESNDEQERRTTFTHDALGRLRSRVDLFGNKTEISYEDRIVRISLNGNLRMVQREDGYGRPLSIQSLPASGKGDPRGITYRRDGLGLVIAEIHSRGDAVFAETAYVFNAEGNVRHARFSGYGDLPAGVEVTPVYDLLGAMIARPKTTHYKDGETYVHNGNTYEYDRLGRPRTITDSLGGEEGFRYLADGRLSARTRPDGTTLRYDYNTAGRLAKLSWEGGEIRYDYATNGRVVSISDAGGTITYDYFNGGSLRSVIYPDGRRRTYAVDAFDRVIARTDPSGAETRITYDTFGRVTGLSQGDESLSYLYGTVNGAKGGLTGIESAGIRLGYGFDPYGGLASTRAVEAAGKELLNVTYERDAAMRLTAMTLSSAVTGDPLVNGRREFAYDGLGQLCRDGGTTFRFDGNGNLIETADGASRTAYRYDAADRLSADGVRFDANGRMTADGSFGFDYDPLDRLIRVRNAEREIIADHTYLPNGALVETRTGEHARRVYFDGGVPDSVRENDTWTSYLVGDGEYFAALNQGKVVRSYLKAHTSTALTIDPDGAAASASDAFGFSGKAGPDIGWNQEIGEAAGGLIYLRSRWYCPRLRRFISPDRLLRDNRYAYCDGDPINRIDPLGEEGDWLGETLYDAAATLIPLGVAAGVSITAGALVAKAMAAVKAGATTSAYVGSAVSSTMGTLAGESADALIKTGKLPQDLGQLAGSVGIAIASGGVATFTGQVAGRFAGRTLGIVPGVGVEAIERVRFTVGGLVGGVSGAVASAGMSSLFYNQPFFSMNTLASIAWGGFRDSLVGRYWHGRSINTAAAGIKIPALSVSVVGLATPTNDTSLPALGERPADYRPSPPFNQQQNVTDGGANAPFQTLIVPPGPAGGTLAGTLQFAGGYMGSVAGYSSSEFIEALFPLGGLLGSGAAAKRLACHGAHADGRLLADSVGRTLFAGYGMIDVG